jgi:hypothetical protein
MISVINPANGVLNGQSLRGSNQFTMKKNNPQGYPTAALALFASKR